MNFVKWVDAWFVLGMCILDLGGSEAGAMRSAGFLDLSGGHGAKMANVWVQTAQVSVRAGGGQRVEGYTHAGPGPRV